MLPIAMLITATNSCFIRLVKSTRFALLARRLEFIIARTRFLQLRRHAFDGEVVDVGALARVLEGDGADRALCVEIENRVFIELA